MEPDPDTIELPPPKAEPGATAVDDHVGRRPGDLGHQPTEGLDRGTDVEHLHSSSQGVKVEERPAEQPPPDEEPAEENRGT